MGMREDNALRQHRPDVAGGETLEDSHELPHPQRMEYGGLRSVLVQRVDDPRRPPCLGVAVVADAASPGIEQEGDKRCDAV